MNRKKNERNARRKAGKSPHGADLISVYKRYFTTLQLLPTNQNEQYSLEQPFPFPSVPTVTTTSVPYFVGQG